jgi:hypothetical protein
MPLAPTRPMSRFMITLAVCLAMSKAGGGRGRGPKMEGLTFWDLSPTPRLYLTHANTSYLEAKTGHFCKHYYHGKI